MALSEADTRAKLIDPAIHACGWAEDMICRETTLGAVEIVAGKARRRSGGRTDYTLRVRISTEAQPVAVALLEAKKDTLPPGHGLDQVKGYLAASRHNVQFVFSSNGYLFVEFDRSTVDAAIWSICDIMRRGNVASALQYVPELTWILFLRILDETEDREEQEADAVGASYTSSLKKPYRWKDWAAPPGSNAKPNKRKELDDAGNKAFMNFVNGELIPHLKKLKDRAHATPRRKVISEIMSGVEKTRIDTEKNLLDVLDKVHEITNEGIDHTHVFALSQIYEGLLLKMGEKGSDAGQFFTPREVIRAMVRAIAPKLGETVYDPCCGTGGFLAQAAEYMKPRKGAKASGAVIAQLKQETFWGREKENLIYPIGLERINDRLGELKKARPRDESAIADADTRVAGLMKEAREATNKAEGIENAVYDLKAVNPHRKAEVDHRTPAELLDLVEAKGREVAEALAILRALTDAR